jgi:hypothetical protein
MVTFSRRMVRFPSQPARSCIIFHSFGFVFHAHAISGLVITEGLIEIQTSTHGLQSPITVKKSRPKLGRHTQFYQILYKIKKMAPGLLKSFFNSQNVTLHQFWADAPLNRAAVSLIPPREPDWQGKAENLISVRSRRVAPSRRPSVCPDLRANKQPKSNRLSRSSNMTRKLGGAFVDSTFALKETIQPFRR